MPQADQIVWGPVESLPSNRAIAERMTVGVRTVETHVQAVFAKLALKTDDVEHRRVVAVLEYLRVRDEGA